MDVGVSVWVWVCASKRGGKRERERERIEEIIDFLGLLHRLFRGPLCVVDESQSLALPDCYRMRMS